MCDIKLPRYYECPVWSKTYHLLHKLTTLSVGIMLQSTVWDVGRMKEKFVNHQPWKQIVTEITF